MRRTIAGLALLLLGTLPAWLGGCRHLGTLLRMERPHCEGQSARDGPYPPRRLHLRAELLHEGAARRSEAVLELGPDGVALVGLTPFGTHAFSVRPGDDGLVVENRVGRYLGQHPRLLFDAVARAWLAPDVPNDAEQVLPRADERVAWRDGERVFLAAKAAPDVAPGARVAFDAEGVRVTSRWCRYDARLVVVSDTPGAAPAP